MIQAVPRTTLFEQYPTLAYSIGVLQYEEKEYWLLEAETDEEFSDMVSYFDYACDSSHFITEKNAQKYVGELVISVTETKDVARFLQDFTQKLQKLCHALDIKQLYFLLEFKENWFKQQNPFAPVKQSLTKLAQALQTATFEEAIAVPIADLSDFYPIIFWLSRCNMQLPQIWVMPENPYFVANHCEKSNLHLHFYNQAHYQKCQENAQKLGFQKIDCSKETERFAPNSTVEGRMID